MLNELVESGCHCEHCNRLVTSSPTPYAFSGGIGISPLEVACAMSTAFEAFARTKPHYVKKIKVVVYEQSITAMFQKNIVEVKGKKLHFKSLALPAAPALSPSVTSLLKILVQLTALALPNQQVCEQ